MKITFLTPHINISGGVKIILGYADRLANREHEITVICPQPGFSTMRIKGRGIPSILPRRFLMNLVKHKPSWIDVAADIKYVASWEEKHIPDADIVIATAWQTARYVRDYSPEKGKKFYLIQHYESLYHAGNRIKEADETYRYPFKKIVVSTWLKETMNEKFNSDAVVIVNPIDLAQFCPTRNEYNNEKRICMLHHALNWKGLDDGIRAFQIAKDKFPDIQLIMFGTHKKKVFFDCMYYHRPWGDKLNEIYNSCDIFLCPSWGEGFGLPSAEAMACKCALVTTDNGGCRDYAIHGKTALVSQPKNPEKLAQNLIKLLENEELLETIAQNGYDYIKQFTWEKAVDKMEKVFQRELQHG